MWTELASIVTISVSLIDPPPVAVERYRLDNGVRVIIAHVPDAPRQATFTLLPLHMGNDGPGKAQWSHLLEHHLIRSTDPIDLAAPGIDINGETMHHSARLDTISLPEHWPSAIERHGRWLASRTFNADVHGRELKAIHGEEQAVSMTGWTHKFSLAAWNQIVRHGQDHTRVHGDVADSRVEDVMQYATQFLPIDDSVWLATVGPIEPQHVKAALAEHVGRHATLERRLPPMSRQGDIPPQLVGTWDLPTRHVLLWWQLPDRDAPTAAAAMAVGDALFMRLAQDPAVKQHVRAAVVQALVPAPEATYFIINASLQRDADPAEAAESLRAATIAIAGLPGPVFVARQLPTRMLDPTLLQMHRAQSPAEMAHFVEANWMLQGVLLEYAAGCDVEELKKALADFTQQDAVAFIDALRDQPHGTLVLEPRQAGDLQQ